MPRLASAHPSPLMCHLISVVFPLAAPHSSIQPPWRPHADTPSPRVLFRFPFPSLLWIPRFGEPHFFCLLVAKTGRLFRNTDWVARERKQAWGRVSLFFLRPSRIHPLHSRSAPASAALRKGSGKWRFTRYLDRGSGVMPWGHTRYRHYKRVFPCSWLASGELAMNFGIGVTVEANRPFPVCPIQTTGREWKPIRLAQESRIPARTKSRS